MYEGAQRTPYVPKGPLRVLLCLHCLFVFVVVVVVVIVFTRGLWIVCVSCVTSFQKIYGLMG